MQDQISMRILKLCKRLDKFTFDDILMIASNIDESVLKLQLIEFVQDKGLSREAIYIFIRKEHLKKIIQYYHIILPKL